MMWRRVAPALQAGSRRLSIQTQVDVAHEGHKAINKIGIALAGGVVGVGVGFYFGDQWGTSRAAKKAEMGYKNYSQTLGARLDKQLGQEDISTLLNDERVKNAFSIKEVKMLFSVLPKWASHAHHRLLVFEYVRVQDITLWEFKDALNRLESAKLHYKTPELINKAASAMGKPNVMKQGAEKFHTPEEITDDMALRIFQMFDLDGNGKVNSNEIITVFAIFCDGADDDKARLLFDVWDYNGDNKITKKEMREAYKKLHGKGLHAVTAGQVFTSIFFNICDEEKTGEVTKEQFVAKYGDKKLSKLVKLMSSDHYLKFLNKQDFPEMARCFQEAYNTSRSA